MIANKLSVLLAERQITIKDVVEGTGLSRNTISNLINKNMTSSISLNTLNKICMFLSVEPKDFFVYSPYDLTFSCIYVRNVDGLIFKTKVVHNNSVYDLINEITINDNSFTEEYRSFDIIFNDDTTDAFRSINSILNSLNIMFKRVYMMNIQQEIEKKASDYVKNLMDKNNKEYTCNYVFPWASYPKKYIY